MEQHSQAVQPATLLRDLPHLRNGVVEQFPSFGNVHLNFSNRELFRQFRKSDAFIETQCSVVLYRRVDERPVAPTLLHPLQSVT